MIIVTGTHLPLGGAIAHRLERLGHEVLKVNRAVSLGHPTESLSTATSIIHADIHLHASRVRTAVDSNILGTRAVRKCAGILSVPVVYLSSIVAQGPSTHNIPHEDTTQNMPQGVVARSIGISEQLLLKSNVDADIFRLAIPYGFDGSFDSVCETLRRSRIRPLLNQIKLSFIHVDDVVEGILKRIESRNGPAFFGHLSDGVERSSEDLLNALERTAHMAVRLPFGVPKTFWKFADRVTSPFGNWDMMPHLSYGWVWTSRSKEAEALFGFTPVRSWSEHLRRPRDV